MEPSPTAEATRLIEPVRTSPAANTPGRLVSRGDGCYGRFRHRFRSSTERSNAPPVRTKPRSLLPPKPAGVQGGRPHAHARTALAGIVYAFPEARPCHSRVAEELEGYGGEQLELRGGHFVPTGEGNDVIKNSGKSCSEMQSPLGIIPSV